VCNSVHKKCKAKSHYRLAIFFSLTFHSCKKWDSRISLSFDAHEIFALTKLLLSLFYTVEVQLIKTIEVVIYRLEGLKSYNLSLFIRDLR